MGKIVIASGLGAANAGGTISARLPDGRVVQAKAGAAISTSKVIVMEDDSGQFHAFPEAPSTSAVTTRQIYRSKRKPAPALILEDYFFKVLQPSSIEGFDADINLSLTDYTPVGIVNTGAGYMAVLRNYSTDTFVILYDSAPPFTLSYTNYTNWIGGESFYQDASTDLDDDQTRTLSLSYVDPPTPIIINSNLYSPGIYNNLFGVVSQVDYFGNNGLRAPGAPFDALQETYDFANRLVWPTQRLLINFSDLPTDLTIFNARLLPYSSVGFLTLSSYPYDGLSATHDNSTVVFQDEQITPYGTESVYASSVTSGIFYASRITTDTTLIYTKFDSSSNKTYNYVKDYIDNDYKYKIITPTGEILLTGVDEEHSFVNFTSFHSNLYDRGPVIHKDSYGNVIHGPTYNTYPFDALGNITWEWVNPGAFSGGGSAGFSYSGEKHTNNAWEERFSPFVAYSVFNSYDSIFSGSGTRNATINFNVDGSWNQEVVTSSYSGTRDRIWSEFSLTLSVYAGTFSFFRLKDYQYSFTDTRSLSWVLTNRAYTSEVGTRGVSCDYPDGKNYSSVFGYGDKSRYAHLYVQSNLYVIDDLLVSSFCLRFLGVDVLASSAVVSGNNINFIGLGLNSYAFNNVYKTNILAEENTGTNGGYNEGNMTITSEVPFVHNPENLIGRSFICMYKNGAIKKARTGVISSVLLAPVPNTQKFSISSITLDFDVFPEEEEKEPELRYFSSDFFLLDDDYFIIYSPDDCMSGLIQYVFGRDNVNYYLVSAEGGGQTIELAISQAPETTDEQDEWRADIYRFNTATLKWERRPNAVSPLSQLTEVSSYISYHPDPSG